MMIRKLKQQRLTLITCLALSMLLHLLYGLEGIKQMEELEQKISRQAAQLRDRDLEIEIQQMLIEMQDEIIQEYISKMDTSENKYIGEFEITYYTAGPESTGKYPGHPAYGITKSGTTVEEGRTIAADWSVLPVGTKVYIDGIGERIVEDTGGMIVDKAIDVYVEDVETALNNGRHMTDVWIVEE